MSNPPEADYKHRLLNGKDEKQEWLFKVYIGFFKQMKINCGAQRHHYSMFNVGRSMFDVLISKLPCTVKCNL